MLNLTSAPVSSISTNYASTKNARFTCNKSNVRTVKERWEETFNGLPALQQRTITHALNAAKFEFHRRYPHVVSWSQIGDMLAVAHPVKMSQVAIDATMQRQLNIEWVLELLNKFLATKVVPIQVYRPDLTKDEYLAWDGQHTLVLLWLIATQILGVSPEEITIPVNIYASNLKQEMRENFVDLNSTVGKRPLDIFDRWEQMVYGVRVDGSKIPAWLDAEKKQQVIESRGFFVTKKQLGDYNMPGAISRMQEINKLPAITIEWLCDYLVGVGAQHRPVEEKEIVMMAYFFERCRLAGIKVNQQYAFTIASVTKLHWDADFSPTSKFWVKVSDAYRSWHVQHGVYGTPRLNKEPVHGYPFLIEQLTKDLAGIKLPNNRTNSEFVPAYGDLF